jgi:hypothetical protein
MKRIQTISISPENAVFSSHDLIFLPIEPNFQPTDEQFKQSMALLESDYPDSEIIGDCFEYTQFIDAGQHFDTIYCPYCNTEIPLETWQNWMTSAFQNSQFENLAITTACCSKQSQLSSLNYSGEDGFSSFVIRVNNPEPNDAMEKEILEDLGEINQTQFRCFYREA